MLKNLVRVSAFIGCALLLINIIGFFFNLRPLGLTNETLRFNDKDVSLSYEQFKKEIVRRNEETDEKYAARLTETIAKGLAHLKWEEFPNDKFHQRVPVWENYILYLMGVFSSIPEYERYHFSSPEKSMERGIGICGDASILMSQLLEKEGIDNKIITIPGHVMVNASIGSKDVLLDPDFGVALTESPEFYQSAPGDLIEEYQKHGYINNGELMIARNLSVAGYQSWNGVSHFITKKYYFEKLSYILKWLIPIVLLTPIFVLRRYLKKPAL